MNPRQYRAMLESFAVFLSIVMITRYGFVMMNQTGFAFPFAVLYLLLALGTLAIPGQVKAETIAISLPISGDAAELGRNFRTGAKLAIEKLELKHQLFIADDGCDPDLASIAAKDIVAMKASIVIGMLCNDPAKIVASELVGTSIPILVAGARSPRLIKDREREEWNIWRMSPGDDYPVEIAAQAIAQRWRETPYAVVDDGTIYGRSFTDELRAKMRERGLEPQFADTFRAAQSTQAGLLRRLQRSGVTAAFIASSTTEDLFTIASDAKKLGINLTIMTTEAMAVLPFLEDAERVAPGLMVIAPQIAANPILEELLEDREIRADRHLYMGFAAIQIAQQWLNASKDDNSKPLSAMTFRTVLGPINFAENGSADYNPYQLTVWDGEKLTDSIGN